MSVYEAIGACDPERLGRFQRFSELPKFPWVKEWLPVSIGSVGAGSRAAEVEQYNKLLQAEFHPQIFAARFPSEMLDGSPEPREGQLVLFCIDKVMVDDDGNKYVYMVGSPPGVKEIGSADNRMISWLNGFDEKKNDAETIIRKYLSDKAVNEAAVKTKTTDEFVDNIAEVKEHFKTAKKVSINKMGLGDE